MWPQIVGKTRSRHMENHWWNVSLYVTPGGFSTSLTPFRLWRSEFL
jgi:hypothetical protein